MLRNRVSKILHLANKMFSEQPTKLSRFLLILLALSITNVNAIEIECQRLSVNECAYAVSSVGARCVLEKYVLDDGVPEYECQTSNVMVDKRKPWIEKEECMEHCGLQRLTLGLSTDALLEPGTIEKLCSSPCQKSCPNIIDLYTKLGAGEGLNLTLLCDVPTLHSRSVFDRPVVLRSSGLPYNQWVAAEPWRGGTNDEVSPPPSSPAGRSEAATSAKDKKWKDVATTQRGSIEESY